MMSGDDQALRIFAWIVPRVNSTALTKCMSYVDDTVVWMEPHLSCHMNETYLNPEWRKGDPVANRMRARVEGLKTSPEIIKLQQVAAKKTSEYNNLFPQENFTREWLKGQLESPEPSKKVIFIKDQVIAIHDQMETLPENVPTRHIILTRHPREVYTSWKNVAFTIENFIEPKSWDECHVADTMYYYPVPEFYQIQHKAWKHIKKHVDPDVIVIDGHDLASNPDVILPKLFRKLGIPFKESYLEWKADPEAVYSSWKGSPLNIIIPSYSAITGRAVNCTKFEAPKRDRGVSNPEWRITDELKGYIEGAMPYYEEMYANRLT